MQVIYKILVVIRPKKIKQKQTLSCQVWCLLNSCAHCLTLCHTSFTANTQITNFFIAGTSRSNIIIFHFLDSASIFFFLSEWKHIFLGAPSQDRTSFFSYPWTTFLDAFLKKRMATPTWKSKGSAECRVEINL